MTVTIDRGTLAALGRRPGADASSASSRDLVSLYAGRIAAVPRSVEPARQPRPATPVPFGRAVWLAERAVTLETQAVADVEETALIPEPEPVRPSRPRAPRQTVWRRFPVNGLRRLVAAAFAVTLLLASIGGAQAAQQRYRVQPGDTLESVAAKFGVDPAAILRASWVANPPELTPGDVIVIPRPGQSPEDAAAEAAAREGTSPWVSGAYYVQAGDTIETIAATFGVDPGALVELNALDDPDLLLIGQRILIPGEDAVVTGAAPDASGSPPGLAGTAFAWAPTYQQQRSLSCEYASAYIATSAFGAGIPESVFIERIPRAKNPHNGYRGNIDGRWGEYTDYGIYPEPLVPVLNDHGFVGEVFYGEYDPAPLKAHLDAGHPVIVWLALWGDTGIVFEDEGRYTVFAGEHVMVAYAYDAAGVFLSDPGTGRYRFYAWDAFIDMWGTSDGMSLAVYPA